MRVLPLWSSTGLVVVALASVPVLVVFLLAQRHFISGLQVGAVRG